MSSKPRWFIKVKETVYGPYGEERMKTFAREGRLNARSQVRIGAEGEFLTAQDDTELASLLTQTHGEISKAEEPSTSHRFVIFAKITESSHANFVETLSDFGVATEVMPEVWLLSAPARADALRNALSQALGHDDALFIADASKGKSAWFNIGKDADSLIRQFWQESE